VSENPKGPQTWEFAKSELSGFYETAVEFKGIFMFFYS
jgi:hypothetical protein